MMDIYRRALAEANYKATRFLQMLHEHRGLATAQILLHSATVSDGYTALWERDRLDLTVEALVLQNGKDSSPTKNDRSPGSGWWTTATSLSEGRGGDGSTAARPTR